MVVIAQHFVNVCHTFLDGFVWNENWNLFENEAERNRRMNELKCCYDFMLKYTNNNLKKKLNIEKPLNEHVVRICQHPKTMPP